MFVERKTQMKTQHPDKCGDIFPHAAKPELDMGWNETAFNPAKRCPLGKSPTQFGLSDAAM